jgi:hypothetical protein
LIVPEALEELDDVDELAPGLLVELELELELLDPQAATPSATATPRATALIRLLLNVASFTLRWAESLRHQTASC